MNREECLTKISEILWYYHGVKFHQDALEDITYYIDNYAATLENKNERLESQVKHAQQARIDNCHHQFGYTEWYGPCNGSRTCMLCGHTEDIYERD